MALLCRNINFEDDTSKSTYNHPTGDPLAIIYNEGFWRLFKVSPMYKMLYKPVKLKMYASKVKQAIVSAVQTTSAKYSVKFEELPTLRYGEEDASGLMVTVSSALEHSGRPKVVYVAVLLNWGQNEKVDETVHLPYMLERGEQKVATSVRSTMQSLFDCSIKQFSFTQQQLLQFGFNFVVCDNSKSTDPFTITYKTPQVEHKEKLSLSFEVGDISIIWQGMKDQAMTYPELVNYTYQILQNQIFHMIMLDITVFDVSEIRLSKAEIKGNGVVKMKTPEMVNSVFTTLNEISSLNMM